MITAILSSAPRGSRRCSEILKREAAPEDRELLLSLAPVLFAEMPAALALDLPAAGAGRAASAATSASSRARCRPAHQLYKGLPGIHVSARNPSEDEARAIGGGRGLPLETHDRRDPHPRRALHLREPEELLPEGRACGSSRRSTRSSRCGGSGSASSGSAGAQEEGAKECYCHFQIERDRRPRSACAASSTRSSRC